MAKMRKELMVNGKKMKKWVEEFSVFEFGEDGNVISPESGGVNEKCQDYDEFGNRKDLPEYDCAETTPNNLKTFESVKQKLNGGRGHISYEIEDEYCTLNWTDENGEIIHTDSFEFLFDFFDTDFDPDGHLVYFSSERNDKFFFEYDTSTDLLTHIKVIDRTSGDTNDEFWFEYEDGRIIHKKTKSVEEWFDYDGILLIHEKFVYLENQNPYYEAWNEYDSNGRLIHKKTKKDFSDNYFYEYDSNGKLIHEKRKPEKNEKDDFDSDHASLAAGYEEFYEYDTDGKLVYEKSRYEDAPDYDFELVYRYDSNGTLIHKNTLNGRLEWKWDCDGHLIYSQKAGDTTLYDYDADGSLIYMKCSDGEEFEWNKNGCLIYITHPEPFSDEIRYEYDKNGLLIHSIEKTNEGTEEKNWFRNPNGELTSYKDDNHLLEFDSFGNIIHYFDGDIDEWYEYEFYDNGTIKKKTCLRGI